MESRKSISPQDFFDRAAGLLAGGEAVRFTVTGDSMRPFIRGGLDDVLLDAPDGPPRRGDIVALKTDGGVYLLHRITALTPGGFVTQGDWNLRPDGAFRPEQRIGRVVCIFRGKRRVRCGSPGFRLLSALWLALAPQRLRLRRLLGGRE